MGRGPEGRWAGVPRAVGPGFRVWVGRVPRAYVQRQSGGEVGWVEFRRPWPPLQAPRLCLHGSEEGRARGDKVSSVLALPCCRRNGSVDWGGEGGEGASANGLEDPPLAVPAATRGGGGGVRTEHVRY